MEHDVPARLRRLFATAPDPEAALTELLRGRGLY